MRGPILRGMEVPYVKKLQLCAELKYITSNHYTVSFTQVLGFPFDDSTTWSTLRGRVIRIRQMLLQEVSIQGQHIWLLSNGKMDKLHRLR